MQWKYVNQYFPVLFSVESGNACFLYFYQEFVIQWIRQNKILPNTKLIVAA